MWSKKSLRPFLFKIIDDLTEKRKTHQRLSTTEVKMDIADFIRDHITEEKFDAFIESGSVNRIKNLTSLSCFKAIATVEVTFIRNIDSQGIILFLHG
jgi:hypothetical protein